MEKDSSGRMKSRGLWIRGEGTIFRRYHGSASQSFTKPPLAQAVLDARAAYPEASLADLYDPDLMPPNLRKAHPALDRAVPPLYRRGGFASERERVEHLFGLYEKMTAPLEARMKEKPTRKQRKTGRKSADPSITGR